MIMYDNAMYVKARSQDRVVRSRDLRMSIPTQIVWPCEAAVSSEEDLSVGNLQYL